jgi:hypothetical protein
MRTKCRDFRIPDRLPRLTPIWITRSFVGAFFSSPRASSCWLAARAPNQTFHLRMRALKRRAAQRAAQLPEPADPRRRAAPFRAPEERVSVPVGWWRPAAAPPAGAQGRAVQRQRAGTPGRAAQARAPPAEAAWAGHLGTRVPEHALPRIAAGSFRIAPRAWTPRIATRSIRPRRFATRAVVRRIATARAVCPAVASSLRRE